MSKTMIAPLVALLAVALKLAFGIDLSEELQAQIIDVTGSVIALVLILIGIVKNHNKKVDNSTKK